MTIVTVSGGTREKPNREREREREFQKEESYTCNSRKGSERDKKYIPIQSRKLIFADFIIITRDNTYSEQYLTLTLYLPPLLKPLFLQPLNIYSRSVVTARFHRTIKLQSYSHRTIKNARKIDF